MYTLPVTPASTTMNQQIKNVNTKTNPPCIPKAINPINTTMPANTTTTRKRKIENAEDTPFPNKNKLYKYSVIFPDNIGIEEFYSTGLIKHGPATWFKPGCNPIAFNYVHDKKVINAEYKDLVPHIREGGPYTIYYPDGKYVTFNYVGIHKQGLATQKNIDGSHIHFIYNKSQRDGQAEYVNKDASMYFTYQQGKREGQALVRFKNEVYVICNFDNGKISEDITLHFEEFYIHGKLNEGIPAFEEFSLNALKEKTNGAWDNVFNQIFLEFMLKITAST